MAKNRSLNKIGKEFDKLVMDMKKMASEYAKASGSKKQQLVNKLKDMTKKKKQLQSEMDSAVKAADKDVDLQIDEMTKLIQLEVTKLIKEQYGYIE
jgi:DNA-binding transcriptional regulator YbjK